jgi:hypothetical protein
LQLIKLLSILIVYLKPVKQSIREATEHLLAKNLEIRPLFLEPALAINEEWKSNPYFGVLLRVFSARKSAFSAPRI